MGPSFPLYIVSKGRSEYMFTSKYLSYMGVKHFIVVEPSEAEKYKKAIQEMNLLAEVINLDLKYKETYELCDNLGLTKSTGPGPARNFAWDDSIRRGFSHHWVMDDNIRSFHRLNNNEKVKVSNGAIFKCMEDFVLRYTNIGMAGPNYFMFAPARTKRKPFITNTRIYSCNLINNGLPFRWRGRYNEDTILSLDMLKAGYCTVQFNAFLQFKMPTQSIKGGNTSEFYHKEGIVIKGKKYTDNGTLAKSKMQAAVHPDVSRLVWKFNRWHHYIDYSSFKQKLIKNLKIIVSPEVNNYGMNIKIVK